MGRARGVRPGGVPRRPDRRRPAPEFVAFWLRDDLVLAGMNVNIWDVNEDIQALVIAGLQGRPAVPAKLADPDVPLPETLA